MLGIPFLLCSQTHYQTPIVLRYSPHIKRRTTIKLLKVVKNKQNTDDVKVTSQSIAVNKISILTNRMRKLLWLKSVFICRSYSNNKSGVRFFWTTLYS